MDKKTFKAANEIISSSTEDRTAEEINNIVVDICKKNGITLDSLVKKLDKLSQAKKVTIDKFGDEHYEEDSMVQHKSVLTLLELIGYLKKGPIVTLGVNISTEEREIIDMYGRYSN